MATLPQNVAIYLEKDYKESQGREMAWIMQIWQGFILL